MKYRIQVRIALPMTDGAGRVYMSHVWRDVRPTDGDPYEYADKESAWRALDMCYPEAIRGTDTRLCAVPEAGIDFCETCQGDIDPNGQCHCM